MALAFAASCVIDLVVSLARGWLIGLVTDLTVQLRVISPSGPSMPRWPRGLHRRGPAASSRPRSLRAATGLPALAARPRPHARIEQAHGRLKLVERERVRLQSAVRRLGDAFAAKLELDALLEILLQGSVEALDAAAGRLDLRGSRRGVPC